VSQLPGHSVPRRAFAPTATTPLIGLDHTAGEHGLVWFESLAGHDESELVEATESGQVNAAEPSIWGRRDGSVRHVEVFQVDGVGTSILGRPRHLPRDRRADHLSQELHPQLGRATLAATLVEIRT
jgi:hypothetical protein